MLNTMRGMLRAVKYNILLARTNKGETTYIYIRTQSLNTCVFFGCLLGCRRAFPKRMQGDIEGMRYCRPNHTRFRATRFTVGSWSHNVQTRPLPMSVVPALRAKRALLEGFGDREGLEESERFAGAKVHQTKVLFWLWLQLKLEL